MSSVAYRIYPSLLDKFQSYLDAGLEAEGFWNIDSETGEQKRTEEEIAAVREQELLDSINRVPHEPIEAADKGTCFNEIVDIMAADEPFAPGGERRDDMDLELLEGEVVARMHGFEFRFDRALCMEVASEFSGAVPQHLCRGVLPTRYGDVLLYGYADEILLDKVYDLKTTSSYSFGKFERAWQKDVYPWCLVSSGEMDMVREFEYTVIQLTKPSQRNPVIGGKLYREAYTYDHEAAGKRLTAMVERFVEWLEQNRERITDKKIFGL